MLSCWQFLSYRSRQRVLLSASPWQSTSDFAVPPPSVCPLVCVLFRLGEAEGVLERLRAAGFRPDHSSYNPLILAHARAGHAAQVARLLQAMRKDGLTPCEVLCTRPVHP